MYVDSDHNLLPRKKVVSVREIPALSYRQVQRIIKDAIPNTYITERVGEGDNKVILLPEAAEELKRYVCYGMSRPMNQLEQKFNGYGKIFRSQSGAVTIVVAHIIPIHTMNRGRTGASNLSADGKHNPGLDFLEYYIKEYLRYEKIHNLDAYGYPVNPFLEHGSSELVLIGHTHPDLGAFFSVPDRELGAARAAVIPIASFVCDPIRKEMVACVGKEFEMAEIIIYGRNVAKEEDSGYPDDIYDEDDRDETENMNDVSGDICEHLLQTANQILCVEGNKGNVRCHTYHRGCLCTQVINISIRTYRREG